MIAVQPAQSFSRCPLSNCLGSFFMSMFSAVEMAPRDPILGLNEQFNADANPAKVNLGVGVYYDDNGKVPLLECVKRAEQLLASEIQPRSYLPIDGMPAYTRAVQDLILGNAAAAVRDQRVVTI